MDIQLILFENQDATIDTSSKENGEEGHCISDSYSWFLTIITQNISINKPLVTLQASNDRTNWFDYSEDSTNVELLDEGIAFKDINMYPRFFRIKFLANGNTTGTLSAILELKRN